MYVLVTNDNVQKDNYTVKSFDKFIEEASSDTGIDSGDGLYIDVNSVSDGDMYEALVETGASIDWISFNGNTPDWFNGTLTPLPNDLDPDALDDVSRVELANAMSLVDVDMSSESTSTEPKPGRIIAFGSAKGGSGKTFTSIITAVYYAKDHPNERVCILDLDIEEPQIGIVIKKLTPTLKQFYSDWVIGNTSFEYLEKCKNGGDKFPPNLDFYLPPNESHTIQDPAFWECVMYNLFMNYDMVFLDTGTTYMETPAIVSAYKVADKINIVAMANLASTVTVGRQIKRLTGEIENDIYSPDDDLYPKLNIVVTNSFDDQICDTIVSKLDDECPVIAKFGNMAQKINTIQVLGDWDLLDNNVAFREGVKVIYS